MNERQQIVARKMDDCLEEIARGLWAFVVDTANTLDPMIRAGKLRYQSTIAEEIQVRYERNELVMQLEAMNPWIVPAAIHERIQRTDDLLHLAWLGSVSDEEARAAFVASRPVVPANKTAAKETAARAAQSILVWAILHELQRRGVSWIGA